MQEVQTANVGQHHATIALREPGEGLVTWHIGMWVTAATLSDGVLGAPLLGLEEDTLEVDHPQVLWDGQGYLMVATHETGLAGVAFDADGTPHSDVRMLLSTDEPLWPDLAVHGDDDPVVIWSRPNEIRGASVGEAFETVQPIPAITGLENTVTPTVRASPLGLIASWADGRGETSGVPIQHLDTNGAVVGPSFEVDRLPSIDETPRPALAVRADGGFAVAWRYQHVGTAAAAWVRLYDAADQALIELSLHDTGPARRPVLATDGETLFVAWEGIEADGHHVRMRLYDFGDLTPLTDIIKVSEANARAERPYVTVVPDGDGGLYGVVAWESPEPGGSIRVVRMRTFTWR